ncbi:MAG TPA: ribonuclease HI family protein [Planctomycetota bacterium]|nr:ribonuclease HI family protein [Planctomycetota bacterium]
MAKLTDRQIAHLIRKYLDVERLLAEHPELTQAELAAFWVRHALNDLRPSSPDRTGDLFAGEGPAPAAAAGGGKSLVARCDGASRGNPGPAAIGVVLLDPGGTPVRRLGERVGTTTNNVAEYQAVVRAAQEALRLGASRLTLLLDSELLVFQLRGVYKVKAPHLKPYHERALALLGQLERWEVRHVPREQNAAADQLANEALDSGSFAEG